MRIGEARNLCTVQRPNESRDAYGDVAAGYAALPATIWVDIQRERSTIIDRGPGDQPAVSAKGFAQYGANVQLRDVLDVTGGPESGSKWRVLGLFHPRAKHTELVLEQFTGSLT